MRTGTADRLIVVYKAETGRELHYAYSLNANPTQLIVDVEFVEQGGGATRSAGSTSRRQRSIRGRRRRPRRRLPRRIQGRLPPHRPPLRQQRRSINGRMRHSKD